MVMSPQVSWLFFRARANAVFRGSRGERGQNKNRLETYVSSALKSIQDSGARADYFNGAETNLNRPKSPRTPDGKTSPILQEFQA
jgi:hypothetical protein